MKDRLEKMDAMNVKRNLTASTVLKNTQKPILVKNNLDAINVKRHSTHQTVLKATKRFM